MTHGAPSGRQTRQDDPDAYDDDDDSSSTPPPPDGGFGWVVVFASFAIHVVTDGVTYSFGVMQKELVNYFNVGQGEASWIVSILTGVTLCSGPVSSAFVNKYGCRTVTIAGAILATLCLAVSFFAPNVPTLYLTVGLGTGVGFGLIYLPAVVSVTCYFEKYRSMATGIAVCGSGLGTFIFAPLIGHLITEYGWRGTLLIIAGLVSETAVMGALFRPLEYNKDKTSRRADKADGDGIELNSLLPVPNGTGTGTATGTATGFGTAAATATSTTNTNKMPMADRWPNSTGQLNVNGYTDIRSRSLEHHINSRHTGSQAGSKGKSLHFPAQQANSVHHHHRHHHHHHHHNRDVARLARSQPSLQVSGGGTTSTHHLAGAGVMYRKDIFYQRSLINIPHHGSIVTGLTEAGSHPGGGGGSVTIVGSKVHKISTGSRSEPDDDSVSERAVMCGCVPCSRETKDTLTEMLDFSLFKNKIFIIFTISNLLTSIGFYIPFVFIKPLGESVGVSADWSDFLVSIVGVANTIGRIVLGYLSDKTWINRLFVYNASLTICGFATVLAVFCQDFYTLSVYASVFGFTIGAYVGLTSVIVVDLFGLDKLTNAFGLLLLFQGIASFLGAPLGGWLYDITGTFSYAFYLAGFTIAVSGLMLFFIKGPAKTSDDALKGQAISSDANGNGNGKSAIAAVAAV